MLAANGCNAMKDTAIDCDETDEGFDRLDGAGPVDEVGDRVARASAFA
jgi:hypothetical protein